MGDQPDDTAELIGRAVQGLEPGGFVTKYVVVAEVIGEDGSRSVWSTTGDDATRWDVYGLLHEALMVEQAEQMVRAIEDRNDD